MFRLSQSEREEIPTIIVNLLYVCCTMSIALSMRLCPRDFRLPNYHYAKTKAVLYFNIMAHFYSSLLHVILILALVIRLFDLNMVNVKKFF